LEFINEQTPELCLVVVKNDDLASQFVKQQTPKLCLAVVKQDGFTFVCIKEQTPELYLEVLNQMELNPNSFGGKLHRSILLHLNKMDTSKK